MDVACDGARSGYFMLELSSEGQIDSATVSQARCVRFSLDATDGDLIAEWFESAAGISSAECAQHRAPTIGRSAIIRQVLAPVGGQAPPADARCSPRSIPNALQGIWGGVESIVDACSTTGRITVDREECALPFVYNGKTYNDCTTIEEGREWCSLSTEYDGAFGFCAQQIPDSASCVGGEYERACNVLMQIGQEGQTMLSSAFEACGGNEPYSFSETVFGVSLSACDAGIVQTYSSFGEFCYRFRRTADALVMAYSSSATAVGDAPRISSKHPCPSSLESNIETSVIALELNAGGAPYAGCTLAAIASPPPLPPAVATEPPPSTTVVTPSPSPPPPPPAEDDEDVPPPCICPDVQHLGGPHEDHRADAAARKQESRERDATIAVVAAVSGGALVAAIFGVVHATRRCLGRRRARSFSVMGNALSDGLPASDERGAV